MHNWVINCAFLLFLATPVQAAVPSEAQSDARYAKGFLVCNYYSGVHEDGSGNNTSGTNDLNTCIQDAYDNMRAAYLECGTYLISNSVVAYEWQGWSSAQNAPMVGSPHAHTIRGEYNCGGSTRPLIKISTGSTNFNNTATVRPMLAARTFEPKKLTDDPSCGAAADEGLKPSHPLQNPDCFRDGTDSSFALVLQNIDFDTNNKAGAIGVYWGGAQDSGLIDVKITATGSYAAIYNVPGRNGITANLEVIGGQYGVLLSKNSALPGSANLPCPVDPKYCIAAPQGANLVGLKTSGQVVNAILARDQVPTSIVGAEIAHSGSGPAIVIDDGGGSIHDSKITMSGGAANKVAIDNTNGRSLYTREVYVTGTDKLFSNNGAATDKSGGTWKRIGEFAYTDQYNLGVADLTSYPSYPQHSGHFEARNILNGQLGSAAYPISGKITASNNTPPANLRSRHLWSGTHLPAFEDGCITPSIAVSCIEKIVDVPTTGTPPADATSAYNTALSAAAGTAHKNVCVPACTSLISDTLSIPANVNLIGAGPQKSVISYRNNWNPTSAIPMILTADNASSTTFVGLMSVYFKNQPKTYDWMYPFRWRSGRNSSWALVMTGTPYICKCNPSGGCATDNNPRNVYWLTGKGGGKFYGFMGTAQLPNSWDRSSGSRSILFDGNEEPTTLYGANMELGSYTACPYPTTNMEIKNTTAGVRAYGFKREGFGATALIHNSSNVGLFAMGAMTGDVKANAQAWVNATGTSNHYLIGPVTVRDIRSATSGGLPIFREALSSPSPGNFSSELPWPNGAGVIKRGELDDTPFAGGAAPVTAPDLSSVTVAVANRVDVLWNIYDSTALLPAPPTDATGFSVTVNDVAKTPTDVSRVGLNTYELTFAGGTITLQTDTVKVSYAPGNIVAGGTPNPPASAFGPVTANNTLSPVIPAALSQPVSAFRALVGDMTSSQFYKDAAAEFENVPQKFLAGAKFRAYLKMAANTANAASQAFYVCYQHNGGAFSLLGDTCGTNTPCFTTSPDVGDGEPTTQLLTPSEATFVPGAVLQSASTTVAVTLPADTETAYEAVVQLPSNATTGHSYGFCLCKSGGGALDSCTPATATVVSRRSSAGGGGVR